MTRIIYYFLKSAMTEKEKENPICTDENIGEIGDFVEVDGAGYIITDYAEEFINEGGDEE